MEAAEAVGALTNPDRVLYPEQGLTKRGLATYYHAVAEWILPHVAGRPLSLVRCPRGRRKTCFYQKHVAQGMPSAIRGVEIREARGTGVYVSIDDVDGLVALVQIGALELHAWGSRVDDVERPDRMVFDLDPSPAVAWSSVVAGAHELRERLGVVHLESFVRLTGGKGLHVVVPLEGRPEWDRVKRFSRGLARELATDEPERYVTTAAKADRVGKIFVDYLRNTRGATSVASYSTRARRGAPVATPVRWDELTPAVAPDRYSVWSLRRRLAALASDPWEGFLETHQELARAAERRFDRPR